MRTAIKFTVVLLFTACGSNKPVHEHPQPLSVEEHQEHAQVHESEAAVTQGKVEPGAAGNDALCLDQGVPLSSGGEKIRVMKPCWTRAEQNAAYLRAADEQRKAAADHRSWARLLLEAEEKACRDLGAIERKTSPFVRGPDILAVEEYHESSKLMGARVTFRKVKGLSVDWLGKSTRCHQARSAKLGYAKDFMPHCPLVLKDTSVSIVETSEGVVLTLRTNDPIIAAEIYGRALRAKSDEPAGQSPPEVK